MRTKSPNRCVEPGCESHVEGVHNFRCEVHTYLYYLPYFTQHMRNSGMLGTMSPADDDLVLSSSSQEGEF